MLSNQRLINIRPGQAQRGSLRGAALARPDMRRWWIALALATLSSVAIVTRVSAQDATATLAANFPDPQPRMVVPFDKGEKLTFDVRFGGIKVGTGRMEVMGMADVRGREAWHTRFTVKGGIPLYKVNDRLESWIDTRTFESLRFVQDLEEGRRDKERFYEIYPERATYSEKGEVEHAPSVDDPLDD